MLKRLTINNVALISTLELEFCQRLNILSGETGAGKSIIVDSLMLLLGARYDKSLLKYGQESGYVEGVFELDNCAQLLSTLNIDDNDGLIIINRKFNKEGKNEIRVNGRQVTSSMLKDFASNLVDIYGQNEYQSLLNSSEHLKILDYYVRRSTLTLSEQVKEVYLRYKQVLTAIKTLGDLTERERKADLLKYQIEEIENANTYEDEEDDIVSKRRMILSYEKISRALNESSGLLESSEPSVLQLLTQVKHSLNLISEYSQNYNALYNRIESVLIELNDISCEVTSELEIADFDESELDKLEKRLNFIRSLKRKYGNFNAMQKFNEQAKAQLAGLENGAFEYERLLKEHDELLKHLYKLCLDLSKIRRDKARQLELLMIEQLDELGMSQARFEIRFNDTPDFENFTSFVSDVGFDDIEFYLSPNAGQPLMPLIKIISGGEMSRFMLALKVIGSHSGHIPTLIFDEIDTGISGIIGQAVAKKLALLSVNHQILCVTHLPQIAAMADNHYLISKDTVSGQTFTKVGLLDKNGEIEEISRLSGAKDISTKSNQNALEMKQWSENFKKTLTKSANFK